MTHSLQRSAAAALPLVFLVTLFWCAGCNRAPEEDVEPVTPNPASQADTLEQVVQPGAEDDAQQPDAGESQSSSDAGDSAQLSDEQPDEQTSQQSLPREPATGTERQRDLAQQATDREDTMSTETSGSSQDVSSKDIGREKTEPTGNASASTSDQSDAPGIDTARPPLWDTAMPLGNLSAAFRSVARQARPSVVQVAPEVRPGARQRQLSSRIPQGDMEQLRDRFGPLLELDPELRQFFRGRSFDQSSPNLQQYNVPQQIGSASGWVYDEQGHVVTNHHVVARADRVRLIFPDDSEADAVIVGSDPQTDIAVLKTAKQGLTPATLASDNVEQGDLVLAAGSPFRYAFSLSQGIVSATGRQMGILGPQGYENFIQTDAAINPGNSGGPLINMQGEVVGMSTAIASRSGGFAGIGFAIPADMIRDVVTELIQKGKIERGYLGVIINDSADLLATFGVEQGVLIEDVVNDGPAHRAGLQPGDVIVSVNDQSASSARDLRQQVARSDPGQTLQLEIVRDRSRQQVDVTLEQQPTDEPVPDYGTQPQEPSTNESSRAEALVKLGFKRVQPMTQQIAQQYGLETTQGILVLDVRPFSAAAVAGVSRGHIITHVQGQKVTSVSELRDEVEARDLSAGIRLRVSVPGGPGRFLLLSLQG